MASSEQLALSDFIKSVHRKLREKTKILGEEQAWQDHCADKRILKKYASAMENLATVYWKDNNEAHVEVVSRILWTYNTCWAYFANDIIKYQNKEYEVFNKLNIRPLDLKPMKNINNKYNLLDVGSCFNPFKKFTCFDVTALDIAPASDEVLSCDFLSLTVGDSTVINNKDVLELPKNHFDIIVFSLLLEYLPSPKQRLSCCEKAHSLLKTEGLLIIITPDSNHVGANAKYIKSWRFVLADLGFSRIKYEKLPHIHCMAFRKAFGVEIARRWVELHKKEQVYNEIFIPQDFNLQSNDVLTENDVDKCLNQDFLQLSRELPNCDIFE